MKKLAKSTVPEFSTPAKPKPRPTTPSLPPIFQHPITLQVSPDIQVRDVLYQAVEPIGVNIHFGVESDRGLHYKARNKPFIQVLEDVCGFMHWRYTIQGHNIKIEEDKPYFQNHQVHFLKFARDSENQVSSATDLLGEKDNGSNSVVSVKSGIDFWQELEQGLRCILPDAAQYTIHRQAGLVGVMGDTAQQKAVATYLARIASVINSQVLIEVKVIEVALRQEFRTGIDWSYINEKSDGSLKLESKAFESFIQGDMPSENFFVLNGDRASIFSFFLKTLERFGSLKTISSPRLTVLNNQTAVIKVAQNDVFFQVNYQTNYLGILDEKELQGKYKTISSSEIHTKPLGFIMPIQVSIDPDQDEILLFVRPTLSRKVRSVKDPAVQYNAKANGLKESDIVASTIPVIEVREIDSVLRLKSGQIMVLGGLMEVKSNEDRAGPPGSSQVKPLRDLLQASRQEEEISELVILLKATILDDHSFNVPRADQRLMHGYIQDPRPMM